MNSITQEENKLDKLCKEGYKIIYPNSIDGLDFEIDVIEKYTFSSDEKFSPIMTARECPGLNWYEKVFKYRDSLFLIPYHFQMDSAREYFLSFDKDTATKYFGLKYILITSDKKESSSINEFYEKINYILFNPKTNKLVFYVDDNFKSPQARKAEAEKKILSEKEAQLDEDLKSLFNS